MGKVLEHMYISPSRFYAITDGGGDRQIDFISVKNALVALFLKHNFDEFKVVEAASEDEFSSYNKVLSDAFREPISPSTENRCFEISVL